MEREQLWGHFDRIRSALNLQEAKRLKYGFKEWTAKWQPAFDTLVAEVNAEPYGKLLCEFLDWADKRGLAWRGELRWRIPMKGPLIFTPPSTEKLMEVIGSVLGELDLVDSTRRLGRLSEAPTSKTPGARGRKMERSLTVRK
jgi:hypothetical protein